MNAFLDCCGTTAVFVCDKCYVTGEMRRWMVQEKAVQVVGALECDAPEALRIPLGGATRGSSAKRKSSVCGIVCAMNRLTGPLPLPVRGNNVCKHLSH